MSRHCPFLKGHNFSCKGTGVLPWQQHRRCHFVSFVMYISGAKFEEHCANVSRDILYSLFYWNSL